MKFPTIPLLTQVSSAHLVSHLHIMTLPALLPLLPRELGIGFIQLGLALSVFNIVSGLVQAPMGFIVDRFGARRLLIAALLLGSFSFVMLAMFGGYGWLLAAMALAGVANGVYHPADYALLARGIAADRMGRAFSIHTFSGYLGGAIAPGLLLGVAALAGTRAAFALAGVLGLVAAGMLLLSPADTAPRSAAVRTPEGDAAARASQDRPKVFTPQILVLTLLFALLSLSINSISNFSVTALVAGHGVALPQANLALTAFLFASALGVLAGGALADRTQRHGVVAALAFAVAALLVAAVALWTLPTLLLVLALGLAGFLSGVITPSRDMLVKAAAPAGAEGRVFGIVSTGFNVGGAVGPVLYGWLLDGGHPRAIFWASVVFMTLTVVLTLLQEWRQSSRRRRATHGLLAEGR